MAPERARIRLLPLLLPLVSGLAAQACGSSRDAAAPGAGDAAPPADLAAPTECQRQLAARGVAFTPLVREAERPAGRPDLVCLIDDPILLDPVVRGVTFRPGQIDTAATPLLATCSLAIAIDRMAQMLVERQVTDVVHFGIYGCRVIAGTDVISEHARARALDVAAVRVADGAVHTVVAHWERNQPAPVTPPGAFLRELVVSLFDAGVFNVILTPDFNAEHHDHFHLDLTPELRLLR